MIFDLRVMEKKNIIEKIEAIVATSVNHHEFTMTEATTPEDVRAWDSLANAMIITAIEQEFGIKFKFLEMSSWKSMGDLADIIIKKLG